MAGPLLVADNLWNPIAYPLHVFSDQSGGLGPVNNESYRVGDGRRTQFDLWLPGTPNANAFVQVQCDRVRAFNFVALDRGHNLGGVTVSVQSSSDGLAWYIVAQPTIPTGNQALSITNPNGVLTEEGAWVFLMPVVATGLYFRFNIPAMGVGLQPNIVGLWFGMAYQPFANGFLMPWGEDDDQLVGEESVTPWMWRGRGAPATPRMGRFGMKLLTDDEYDLARLWIHGFFGNGAPMWVCYDQAQADRAFLAVRPERAAGGFGYRDIWYPRQGAPDYVELDVLRP